MVRREYLAIAASIVSIVLVFPLNQDVVRENHPRRTNIGNQ
jgi:hypothetical protein